MDVVNVKVKYIRPKYLNLKEWMDDPNNIYIGRRGIVFIDNQRFPKFDSKWANPYHINNTNSREDVCSLYKTYILNKIKQDPEYYNIEELKNKHLGCWCKPEMCHGDILLELLQNN